MAVSGWKVPWVRAVCLLCLSLPAHNSAVFSCGHTFSSLYYLYAMRQILSVIALFSIILFSCKGKDVDCSAIANRVPCYVAFKGFNAADLRMVIQYRYEKGSSFSERLSIDTFRYSNVMFSGDTAFSSSAKGHMGTLFYDADYEIVVPSVSKTFRISELTYTADTVIRWTGDKNGCGQHGTYSVQPLRLKVDGTERL